MYQTVTGLDANTRYEFRVTARYRGDESSTVQSRSSVAKTTDSKCASLIYRPSCDRPGIVTLFLKEQQNDTAAAVSMLGTHERIGENRRSVNTRIQVSQ